MTLRVSFVRISLTCFVELKGVWELVNRCVCVCGGSWSDSGRGGACARMWAMRTCVCVCAPERHHISNSIAVLGQIPLCPPAFSWPLQRHCTLLALCEARASS
jgi:hypothetical protein